MKIRGYFIYSLFIWIGLFLSCTEDRNSLYPTGVLYLNIEEDATLYTKAQTGVTFESLRVDVLDMNRDTIDTYKDYLSDVKGQRMTLPVGKYIVAVSSNHTGEAGWETPLYQGEEEVEVKQGEITSAQVVCKIANTKVSVLYSEDMKNYFSHYGTTVSNTSGSLTFTRDEYRSGYFTPEELTVSLKLVNKDGTEFVIRKVYPDIKPQYHYKFKFALANPNPGDDPEAGADFGIEVDSTNCTEISCNIFIKIENLFGKGIPYLNITGFGSDTENRSLSWKPLKNGEKQPLPDPSPQLILNVPAGIQEAKVDVNSTRFNSDNLHIDLSKEGEQIVELKELLQDAYTWENLEKPETHTFAIRVLDNLNQEAAIEFSLVITPDLPAETKPANAFSTFAFLEGSSDERENVRFKYWEKSKGVGSAQEVKADANGDGLFKQVVKDLNPNTEYCYQALAGDAEGNVVEFVTEDAKELPNGNFEQWIVDGWPIPTDNKSNVFWGSGNNSFAKELLTKEVNGHQGNAAKMSSMQPPQLFGAPPLGAGNLVTGDFRTVETKGGEITFNRQFSARPSKLKGYLKYEPGNVDVPGTVQFPSGQKNIEVKKGQEDECFIYIALSKEKYVVNTTDKKTLFDLDMPEFKNRIIAYAELPQELCGRTSEYTEFELTLKYLQPDYTGPYYIAIVCSAAKYGDYFIGSTKSVMYVDEFELGYEYDEKCFNNE